MFWAWTTCAQTVEMGVLSSPKAAGACVSWETRAGTVSSARAYFDLTGCLNGKYDSPGFMSDYHLIFSMLERSFEEFSISVGGGPGAAAGFARNSDGKRGIVSGVSGTVQIAFIFHVPLVLSAGFSAMFGCHVTMDRAAGSVLTLYEPGIFNVYIPEITIKYRF